MYVKRNKNRSGSVSIHVLRKVGRSNRLVKSFGTSKDEKELLKLEEDARLWIDAQMGLPLFDRDTELDGTTGDGAAERDDVK